MDQNTVDQDLTKGRTLLTTTVVSGHGLKHLYQAAFSIVLPEIKGGLGLSNAAAGALVTSRELSSGLITLPAGFVADRFSSWWSSILTVSVLLLGLGYFLAGSVNTYWVIVLAIIVTGLATSMWHPAAIASLSSRFPRKRGLAISLHGGGGSVGEVLGPLIAGGLLLILAWPDLLRISLLPAIVASGLVWGALRGMKGQEGVSSVRDYFPALKGLLASRILMAVVLLSGTRSMSHQIMATFVPIYLREDLNYSPFIVGLYVSLMQVAGIATHPVMGILSDRFGRKAALVPGMIAFGLLCIAFAFAAPGVQLTLTLLAIGAFIFTFHSIFLAAALDIAAPEVHGTTVAMVYASSQAIGSLGSVTAGILADAYSIETTFIYAGIVVIVSALFLTALRLPRVRPVAAAGTTGS